MTTLEVVEAVQRSLENEGFLQLIRAQLRSNVLRIISSGPEYSPQTGKAVELTNRKHGLIAIQLVRQLLEQYNMRESLAVLEAEAGLNEDTYLDRAYLQHELNIESSDDESLLESLVTSALQPRGKGNNAENPTPMVESVNTAEFDNLPRDTGDDEGSVSVPEEESVVEDEDEDVGYSQIEDQEVINRDQSRASSAANSPVKSAAAESKNEVDSPLSLDAKHLSPRNVSEAKGSLSPPALHPSFHNHGSKQLDASSSFEADSPARSQASHIAQQKLQAMVLEDSFAEEPEEDLSVEEDIEQEVEKAEDGKADEEAEEKDEEKSQTASPVKKDTSRSFSDEEEGQGPEYDSDHSSHSGHSAAEAKEEAEQRPQAGRKPDSSYSDSDSSVKSAGAEKTPSSLRPAVDGDFDPMDRSAADHSAPASSANRNRVAVRRAAMEAAEGKSSAGDSNVPGAKANVFRLGQSSISRSQLGWGSETSNHRSDGEEENDGEDFATTEKVTRNNSGNNAAAVRYTSTSQMEAVSFDTDEDEDAHQPSPLRAEPRRSSNQESESESEGDEDNNIKNNHNDSSRESAHSGDFEAEEDSEGDVSFGDEEDVLPSVGKGVPARAAFGSPPTKSTPQFAAPSLKSRAEDEEEEVDEYGDDDFIEDEEEEEEEPQQKAAVSGGLFSARTAPLPALTSKAPATTRRGHEEEEEDSVEEEIDEEVEEDMSVGDMDSDEDDDGGFGSPANNAKKNAKQQPQQTSTSGEGMFRAGRSGALPGVSSVAAKGKLSHFDSILNSDGSDSEGETGARGNINNRKGGAVGGQRGTSGGGGSSITDRMREIDSQLEELEQSDPHLADLKNQSDDENSVASEDIDAMEFSTGGGQENDSESSGEGSFSFLDASTKK